VLEHAVALAARRAWRGAAVHSASSVHHPHAQTPTAAAGQRTTPRTGLRQGQVLAPDSCARGVAAHFSPYPSTFAGFARCIACSHARPICIQRRTLRGARGATTAARADNARVGCRADARTNLGLLLWEAGASGRPKLAAEIRRSSPWRCRSCPDWLFDRRADAPDLTPLKSTANTDPPILPQLTSIKGQDGKYGERV
jgi:hypothetical protein